MFTVAEIPRTLSGKVLEVPVKRILMGEPATQVASRDALANPAALFPLDSTLGLIGPEYWNTAKFNLGFLP